MKNETGLSTIPKCQNLPEIRAQHRPAPHQVWLGPASSPAFIFSPVSGPAAYPFIIRLLILSPACARQHRVHATQKPCRARFWAQRRACVLELDISDSYSIDIRGRCCVLCRPPRPPDAVHKAGVLVPTVHLVGALPARGHCLLS